jgi:class 3 adenylate cyclase
VTEALKSLPLPEDPSLAAWASALNSGGHWAVLVDSSWCLAFVTDEMRMSLGDIGPVSAAPIGEHVYGATQAAGLLMGPGRPFDLASRRAAFLQAGPYMLATTPGGREELRRAVDPQLADLVDEFEPEEPPTAWAGTIADKFAGVEVVGSFTIFRIESGQGQLAGFCMLLKPAAGMSQLAAAVYTLDLQHLERMRSVEHADRRPAAVLMADLETSSVLARRMSTTQYFAFGRRLVRAADRCVVDAGGIVGRHAGDGIVAFFLAETTGSESGAARACISAARTLRDSLSDVATRCGIPESELSLRFGLHWGATLYMGRVLTAGRSEVTALGDEVNETARIEACATGGRALASKSLIERLNPVDAAALSIDSSHLTYQLLAELSTATDKARRDAASIAVCEI